MSLCFSAQPAAVFGGRGWRYTSLASSAAARSLAVGLIFSSSRPEACTCACAAFDAKTLIAAAQRIGESQDTPLATNIQLGFLITRDTFRVVGRTLTSVNTRAENLSSAAQKIYIPRPFCHPDRSAPLASRTPLRDDPAFSRAQSLSPAAFSVIPTGARPLRPGRHCATTRPFLAHSVCAPGRAVEGLCKAAAPPQSM